MNQTPSPVSFTNMKCFALAGVAQWIECLSGLSGHQFNSQSGDMPGLQARSPIGGVQEATTHCCFSPFSFPSLLSENKYIKSLKKKKKCFRAAEMFSSENNPVRSYLDNIEYFFSTNSSLK